jgi:hypothetical protein
MASILGRLRRTTPHDEAEEIHPRAQPFRRVAGPDLPAHEIEQGPERPARPRPGESRQRLEPDLAPRRARRAHEQIDAHGLAELEQRGRRGRGLVLLPGIEQGHEQLRRPVDVPPPHERDGLHPHVVVLVAQGVGDDLVGRGLEARRLEDEAHRPQGGGADHRRGIGDHRQRHPERLAARDPPEDEEHVRPPLGRHAEHPLEAGQVPGRRVQGSDLDEHPERLGVPRLHEPVGHCVHVGRAVTRDRGERGLPQGAAAQQPDEDPERGRVVDVAERLHRIPAHHHVREQGLEHLDRRRVADVAESTHRGDPDLVLGVADGLDREGEGLRGIDPRDRGQGLAPHRGIVALDEGQERDERLLDAEHAEAPDRVHPHLVVGVREDLDGQVLDGLPVRRSRVEVEHGLDAAGPHVEVRVRDHHGHAVRQPGRADLPEHLARAPAHLRIGQIEPSHEHLLEPPRALAHRRPEPRALQVRERPRRVELRHAVGAVGQDEERADRLRGPGLLEHLYALERRVAAPGVRDELLDLGGPHERGARGQKARHEDGEGASAQHGVAA